MATRYYSVNFGQDKVAVAETGTTTAGADVEVRVTYTATNNSKQAMMVALELLAQRIQEDAWPPA